MTIKEWQKDIHDNAVSKGFWEHNNNHRTGELLMNSIAEMAEAMEDYRDDKMETYFDEKGKPHGFPSELADIVIRVLDIAEAYGVDLEHEMEIKMKYNKTRSHKHGGKKA